MARSPEGVAREREALTTHRVLSPGALMARAGTPPKAAQLIGKGLGKGEALSLWKRRPSMGRELPSYPQREVIHRLKFNFS
jgi:hypothetical protein